MHAVSSQTIDFPLFVEWNWWKTNNISYKCVWNARTFRSIRWNRCTAWTQAHIANVSLRYVFVYSLVYVFFNKNHKTLRWTFFGRFLVLCYSIIYKLHASLLAKFEFHDPPKRHSNYLYDCPNMIRNIHEQTITISGSDCICACVLAFSVTFVWASSHGKKKFSETVISIFARNYSNLKPFNQWFRMIWRTLAYKWAQTSASSMKFDPKRTTFHSHSCTFVREIVCDARKAKLREKKYESVALNNSIKWTPAVHKLAVIITL